MTDRTDPSIVRLGIIGAGNMGQAHARDVMTLPQVELVAVCDSDEAQVNAVAAQFKLPTFTDFRSLLANTELDGVIIATPHYDHTPVAVAALQKGLHVMVEKPVAVHVNDGRKMKRAYLDALAAKPDLVFGAMFMQRTYGHYRKLKELLESGELGQLVRATWIITDWFRTQAYFDSGGWRATWAGEGGGVLFNQSPHNLDLYQWLFGLPDQVTGFVNLGKYHDIEVEDEVTAYFAYDNGLVGHFITSTAEAPGTNRLEIVGEKGKLVFEDKKLTFYRNRQSMFALIREAHDGFEKGESWRIEIPYLPHNHPGHREMILNFVNAIQGSEPLIAPALEGLNSVMLANAIMLSAFEKRTVALPIDGDLYEQKLQTLIAKSRFQKKIQKNR